MYEDHTEWQRHKGYQEYIPLIIDQYHIDPANLLFRPIFLYIEKPFMLSYFFTLEPSFETLL